MIDLGKRNILGVMISALDYEAAVARIISCANHAQSLTVSALAVHGVMTGVLDPVHRHRLNQIDLVVPDGQPVRWAINWLYNLNLHDRVYGPDLMLKVCASAAQEHLPIFLYGSKPATLNALKENLIRIFPGLIIAGSQASLFRRISPWEKREIIENIQNSGACVVFVGLGCPRQEVWIYEYSSDLSIPLLAVGAAFDFHAGTIQQSPQWLQRHGLEWFYRLAKEPKRLWKRYIFLNPLYIVLLICQKLGLRRFGSEDTVPPSSDLLYG